MEQGLDVFVGRQDAMLSLEERLDNFINTGEPQSIAIVGENGVGKTTLVKRALANKDVKVLYVDVRGGEFKPELSDFDKALEEFEISLSKSLEDILDDVLMRHNPNDIVVFTTNPQIYKKKNIDNIYWVSFLKDKYSPSVDSGIRLHLNKAREMGKFIIFDCASTTFLISKKAPVDKIIESLEKNGLVLEREEIMQRVFNGRRYEGIITNADSNLYMFIEEPLRGDMSRLESVKRFKELVSAPGKHGYVVSQGTISELGDNVIFKRLSVLDKNGFNPTRIEFNMFKELSEFMREYKENAIVLITNIGDLIVNKDVGFIKVFKTISMLKDIAIENGSTLIIQSSSIADNEDVSDKLIYFEREFISNKKKSSLKDLILEYGTDGAIYRVIDKLNKLEERLVVVVDGADYLDQSGKQFLSLLKRENKNYLLIPIFEKEQGDWDSTIRLSGLNWEGVKELVNQLYPNNGGINDAQIKKIYDLTGGNPLRVKQLLKTLEEKGTLFKIENVWRIDSEILDYWKPVKSYSELKRKLNDFDIRVLHACAVLSEFKDEIYKMISIPKEEVYGDINTAIEYSLQKLKDLWVLRESQGSWMMVDSIRNEVYKSLPEKLKRELHYTAYKVLRKLYRLGELSDFIRMLYHASEMDVPKGDKNILINDLKEAVNDVRYLLMEDMLPKQRLDFISYATKLLDRYEELYGFDKDVDSLKKELIFKAIDVYSENSRFNDIISLIEKNEKMLVSQAKSFTYLTLAKAYHRRGDLESAEHYYRQVLDSPKSISTDAHFGLCKILISKGDIRMAIHHLSVLKDFPEYVTYGHALSFLKNKNYKSAVNYFSRLIGSNDSFIKASALLNLGVAYTFAGREEEAKEYIENALRESRGKHPDIYVYSLVNLAYLYNDDRLLTKALNESKEHHLAESTLIQDIINQGQKRILILYR